MWQYGASWDSDVTLFVLLGPSRRGLTKRWSLVFSRLLLIVLVGVFELIFYTIVTE